MHLLRIQIITPLLRMELCKLKKKIHQLGDVCHVHIESN